MWQPYQREQIKAASLRMQLAWLVTILVLVSMLPLGNVQAASLEQSSPSMSYRFDLTASVSAGREGAPVCAGEKVTFIIRAWRSAEHYQDSHLDIPRQIAFNVPVDALVADKNILKVEGPARLTTSITLEDPGAVEFAFKAMKPGQTEIFFEAIFPKKLVDRDTLSKTPANEQLDLLYASVSKKVTVIECPLTLNVLNQYVTTQAAPYQQFIGLIKDAVLQKSDKDENLFVYEGLETVVITERIPSCNVSWNKSERRVEIKAVRSDDKYIITISRSPMVMEVTHECPGWVNTTQLAIPSGGEQTWEVSVRGGSLEKSMHTPVASRWWVLQAKAARP